MPVPASSRRRHSVVGLSKRPSVRAWSYTKRLLARSLINRLREFHPKVFLRLRCCWGREWIDWILRSKVKGQGHSETKYGLRAFWRHFLACIPHAWRYFNETRLLVDTDHRRSQDFVWGCTFSCQKSWWPFLSRRPQRPSKYTSKSNPPSKNCPK